MDSQDPSTVPANWIPSATSSTKYLRSSYPNWIPLETRKTHWHGQSWRLWHEEIHQPKGKGCLANFPEGENTMEDTLEKFTERKVGWRCDVEVIPKTSSNILATYKVGIYVNGSEISVRIILCSIGYGSQMRREIFSREELVAFDIWDGQGELKHTCATCFSKFNQVWLGTSMSVSPSDTKHKSADASPPRKALNHRHSQGAHVPSVMVWQDFSDHHAKFMSTPILKQYRHIVTNIWDSKEVNSFKLANLPSKKVLYMSALTDASAAAHGLDLAKCQQKFP